MVFDLPLICLETDQKFQFQKLFEWKPLMQQLSDQYNPQIVHFRKEERKQLLDQPSFL